MAMTSFKRLGKGLAPVAVAGVVLAALPVPADAQTPI
jgi:hypothetical protein